MQCRQLQKAQTAAQLQAQHDVRAWYEHSGAGMPGSFSPIIIHYALCLAFLAYNTTASEQPDIAQTLSLKLVSQLREYTVTHKLSTGAELQLIEGLVMFVGHACRV